MQLLKRSASAAWISCAKEQLSRCLLHADWMMLNNALLQIPWHTKSVPRMLIASKAAFVENYLAISAWILNGSSIECYEKKRQPSPIHFFLVRTNNQTRRLCGPPVRPVADFRLDRCCTGLSVSPLTVTQRKI